MKQIIFIITIALFLVACGTSEPEPTPIPSPTATSIPKPNIEYSLLAGEEYGLANERGFSYRVVVPADTATDIMQKIAEYEGALLGNGRDVDELTFFIYIDRQPGDDGNWMADHIFEWYKESQSVKDCTGASC